VPQTGVRFSTACFVGEGMELSLRPLQNRGDEKKHPALAERISGAVRHIGGETIYAPYPAEFNAQIVSPTELNKMLILNGAVRMFRNATKPADGTFLRHQGDSGIFSAGGCGLIVATLGDRLLFAHAGRDCVINRSRVLGKADARPFESVVDSIADEFREQREDNDLSGMHVWALYSIKPGDFLHKFKLTAEDVADEEKRHEFMRYNERLPDDMRSRGLQSGIRVNAEGIEIDVPEIIRLQFRAYGVPAEHIHLEHCYLSDDLPTTRRRNGRYLVAVVRH
jgi:hypothetical protein